MGGDGRLSGGGGWWGCLWGTLTIVSLALGVAALWLPLDRHLQIEERLAQLETQHQLSLRELQRIRNSSLELQHELKSHSAERSVWRTKIQMYQANYEQQLENIRQDNKLADDSQGATMARLVQQLREEGERLGAREEMEQQQQQQQPTELAVKVEDMLVRMDDMDRRLEGLDLEVGGQESRLQKHGITIEDMSGSLTREINSLSRRLSEELEVQERETNQSLQLTVSHLGRGLTANLTDLRESLEASLASLQEEVEARGPHPLEAGELLLLQQAVANITASPRQENVLGVAMEELSVRMSALELAVDSWVPSDLQKVLARVEGLEEGSETWEERVRGLVRRINQFQQRVLAVQKLPTEIQHLQNRVARLEGA